MGGPSFATMSEIGVIEWMQGASPMLDAPMLFFTYIATHAALWLVLAFLMTCSVRRRKVGISIMVAVAASYLVVDLLMKPLIDRQRPFELFDLQLIVDPPTTSSFPSGHTASSFAAAASIFHYSRKAGIPALVMASAVGISRVYLCVHWPSDVIAGAVVGIVVAYVAIWFMNRWIPYYRSLPDPGSAMTQVRTDGRRNRLSFRS